MCLGGCVPLSPAVCLWDCVSPSVSATESCLYDHQPVGVSRGLGGSVCTSMSGSPTQVVPKYLNEDLCVPWGSVDILLGAVTPSPGNMVAVCSCVPGKLCVGVCKPSPECLSVDISVSV